MRLTITSDVARVEAAFTVGAAVIPQALEAGIHVAELGVRAVIIPEIRGRTPRGRQVAEDGTPIPSGALARSTRADSREVPGGVDIDVSQPAVSAPNRDGSGGGFPYAVAVIKGRKAIDVADPGDYSTGKAALRTPWGPRKSVKAARGQDYITPSIAAAAGGMHSATAEGAKVTALAIVRVLR